MSGAAATNLYNVFLGLSERFGSQPALVDKSRSITYGQLGQEISRTARALQAEGVEPGHHVGIASKDGLMSMLAMLGAWGVGATAVHVDFRSRSEEKKQLAEEFDLDLMLEDRQSNSDAYHSVVLDDRWRETVQRQSGAPLAPILTPSPAIISLTSGTTARPAGIIVSHESLLCRYMMHIQEGFLSRGKRYLSAIPLSYSASRNHTLVRLLDGATVNFHPPLFDADELAEYFLSTRSTSAYIVPTILRGFMDLNRGRTEFLLPQIEMLFLAGAYTAPEEKLRAREIVTPEIYEHYSSTIAGNISYLNSSDLASHADTVGRVLRHARVEIVDPQDDPLPRGEAGAIRVCSPGMPTAIYGGVERSSGDRLRNGWAYPGDIGAIDQDGFLRILGRASELIVRAGANVHPTEIETVVARMPGVRESAAVGYPSLREGEEIAVFVKTDGTVSSDAVLAHCRANLPPDKRPRKVIIVDDFPRNHAGKIVKRELVAHLSESSEKHAR